MKTEAERSTEFLERLAEAVRLDNPPNITWGRLCGIDAPIVTLVRMADDDLTRHDDGTTRGIRGVDK